MFPFHCHGKPRSYVLSDLFAASYAPVQDRKYFQIVTYLVRSELYRLQASNFGVADYELLLSASTLVLSELRTT